MVRKTYPKGAALMQLFIESFENYAGFEVVRKDSGCLFRFEGFQYYAYIKCISHEGNPYPLEHQRAQLPKRPEFDEIKTSEIPFLFLGYDVDNDVFVCWEPYMIKPRLNKKTYVSFYSRLSAQQNVKEGSIREEVLTNGDKFFLFKRCDSVSFFQTIDIRFPYLHIENGSNSLQDSYQVSIKAPKYPALLGRIITVDEDLAVKLLIDSFPEGTPSLSIVGECMNQFGSSYDKMSFSDWGNLVRTYLLTKEK